MSHHIALIDSDPAVRDSLDTLLSLAGHRVRAYESAGAFLAGADPMPDCVVCEAELPDLSGIELYHRLCAMHSEPRFALLVSRNDARTLERAYAAGIDHVFCKPTVYRQLAAFISGVTAQPLR